MTPPGIHHHRSRQSNHTDWSTLVKRVKRWENFIQQQKIK